ncbi:aspartate transaminase AspB [Barrientosiimonas marina]|uniref:Aminotransferase n=1 Tax=Lentibacillus kimchii TaxID=1542911 RepID=A0ABW2UZX7_9BACI
MELANRVKSLTPSATLAITAKANELKSAGYDVIGLGVGEPDFNTPAYILDAAEEAMRQGLTKYTPSGGIPELKGAITAKLKRDNELTYASDEVIVTTGAKHALYTLFQVLLNKGDEVIVPAPYWVSYPEQVKLAEGQPVYVNADEQNDFKITPDQLKQAITPRTKAFIINSPSNPTGMMYNQQELEQLGNVCVQQNVLMISDEIYEKLIYSSDDHVSVAALSDEFKANTVIINGVSKSHAMTGWRIGYAAGPKDIIQPMTSLASHSTSNPASIAQYAALAAYRSDDQPVNQMREIFHERLNLMYDLLKDIPGISCVKPKGAFYLFPNIQEAVRKGGFDSADDWVKALLEEEKVALVPGSGFGAPSNVRLSYAVSTETLKEAAKRIRRFAEVHS